MPGGPTWRRLGKSRRTSLDAGLGIFRGRAFGHGVLRGGGYKMTNSQRLSVRLSEIRQRLNEVAGLEGEAYTAEIRAENDKLQTEYRDLEGKYRAAVIAEGDAEKRALETEPDAELRERRELRGKASLGAYLRAALSGRRVDGPERELQEASKVGEGIPLELWDTAQPEHRADLATGAPGTVGVNLDRIRPAVFSQSVLPRLGVEMPRVESGTYASATISASLTAGSKAKGVAAQASAATFTVQSVTPKRISARLGIRIEDVAAVGQQNFEGHFEGKSFPGAERCVGQPRVEWSGGRFGPGWHIRAPDYSSGPWRRGRL